MKPTIKKPADHADHVRTSISSMLTLHDAPPALAEHMRDLATFVNPEYTKRKRLGLATWIVPQHLRLWSDSPAGLVLPRGLLAEAQRLAPLNLRDDRLTLPEVDFGWRVRLRPEQREAVARIVPAEGGVLVAPPGSGKTQMALAALSTWRQPALWLVHTLDLARQAADRATEMFDLPEGAIGIMGGGRQEIGTHLTIATVQTLVRRDLADLAEMFGALVLDEAHHAPATTFMETVQAFPARFRLGLTGTPDRADGLGGAMFAVFGPVAARLGTGALVDAGRLVLPEVRQVPTGFRFLWHDDFNALMDAMTADEARNRLIVSRVAQEARQGASCLVLSERVAHCHLLADLLHRMVPEIAAAVLTSATRAKERMAALDAMRAGNLRVLFATKLADEGLDLPNLSRVFLAAGGRSAAKVQQQVGRAMRTARGKTGATVIDFCDWQQPILAAQAKARFWQVYRPLGARVVDERQVDEGA